MSSLSPPAGAVGDSTIARRWYDSRVWRGLLWVALLSGAAWLRWHAIGASSLWNDEGTTWALVQQPVGEIIRRAAADIHPPLYYLLLHGWVQMAGTSAGALRAFSALCGVFVVAAAGGVAGRLADGTPSRRWLSFAAAIWVALNPFQIYYSQEARMYMLLALEAALLLWALLAILAAEDADSLNAAPQKTVPAWQIWFLCGAYVIVAAAGLWTHYSFPIVLMAAAAGYLIDWLLRWRHGRRSWWPLIRFALMNLAALALFAPWLPTAWRQVTTWPQGGDTLALLDGVALTVRTLLFGPIRTAPWPAWGWVMIGAVLPVLGLVAFRRNRRVWPILLALVFPVGLMFALGLLSDAFLKFLIVASLPWCVLAVAASEWKMPPAPKIGLRAAVIAVAAALAWSTLPGYYADSAARDNYQGVAAWLRATADPARDVVLLDAPGQHDVWSYYDPGLPVLALPAMRPANREATEAALAEGLADKRALYALFWATEEADPDGIVENWLNEHWYRGMESWQGHVRLAEYLAPTPLACEDAGQLFGEEILLESACLPPAREVTSGEPFAVELHWRAERSPAADLAVSVQLLNSQNQVVAQHDGAAGGSRPTTSWQPGEEIADRHALFTPIGAPPGRYTLNLVLYDPPTGARLSTSEGDALDLGDVTVLPAQSWPPADVIPMQHRVTRALGPIQLLGYDLYRQGYAHAPETELGDGDGVHVTLYWQAPAELPADWPQDAQFTLTLGNASLTQPLAGSGYPTGAWRPGEVVRADVELTYDGEGGGALRVGDASVSLAMPDGH